VSYYGAGDYYGAGGIGSFLGGIVKKVASPVLRTAASLIPGGSIALGIGTAFVGGGGGGLVNPPRINLPGSGLPGVGIGAFGTPAHMASRLDPRFYTKDGRPRRIRKDGQPWKRPTMDPGNSRAMRRAVRRSNRFVGIARSALAMTKWKVASRSSGTRRGKK